jgi:long-chain fatty acid transport protein
MARNQVQRLAMVLWLTASASCLADGVILNGVSPRSLSRGGTNLGHSDNGGILHDNPAGMVNVEGEGLVDVGMDLLFTDFRYSDPDNNQVTSNRFTPLPQISLIRKSGDGVFAYGLGIFAPAGFSEDYTMQGPFPLLGPQQYKSFGALMKILPGVSCRVSDRLSVGGTFGLGVCYASLEGPYFLQGPSPLAGIPTLLNAHGTGATPVWSAGLQYELTECTTLGATYQSASDFDLGGNTRVTVPGLGSSSYDSTLHVKWPQSVGVGVRQQLSSTQTLSADAIWFDWSHSFDQFEMTLSNPTNPFFPPLVEHFPLRWRDSVSMRLGFEQLLCTGGTLRMGYVYHRNPIPSGTLTPYIQGTMQHAVSVGYGWQLCDWDIDAGYMHVMGPTQNVGTSQLLGGDFSQSSHDAAVGALLISFIKKF